MRTTIITITNWEETCRIERKDQLSFWDKLLIFFKLKEQPEKLFWINANIETSSKDVLYKGDTFLLHQRHECAWMYLGELGGKKSITSLSPVPDMKPYTGPVVIIGQTCSENDPVFIRPSE